MDPAEAEAGRSVCEVKKHYCYRCGHFWFSDKDGAPKACPRCRSAQWDSPVMKRAICIKCGKEWERAEIDDVCPACGCSPSDALPEKQMRCNQCDHEWLRRSADLPKRCPVCKSSRWNEEKIPQHACYRCGYVWRMRSGDPVKCPKCQSARWNKPAYKLQCRRCGYKWSTRNGTASEEVNICPSCKSRKWNETPDLMICRSCGGCYINKSNVSVSRCPSCNTKKRSFSNMCGFCRTVWTSADDDWAICPRCGKPRSDEIKEKTFEIWSDGTFSLRYVHTDDFAFIYLWEGGQPAAVMYFHHMLGKMNMTADQFTARVSDPEYRKEWDGISRFMFEHRDDYIENIEYYMKRLNLCRFDATVLSIHSTGMGPEAIAVKFSLSAGEVRRSFDRIMSAFADNGIVVNDSIFTDDPMSLY